MEDDLPGAEGTEMTGGIRRRGDTCDCAHLRLVAEERVHEREAKADTLDARLRPTARICGDVQRRGRPSPTCPGEEGGARLSDQAFRPPETGSVHMVRAPDCGWGDVARSQAPVRAKGRDEGASPIGPGQGHRGPGGTSPVDSQDCV